MTVKNPFDPLLLLGFTNERRSFAVLPLKLRKPIEFVKLEK